MPSRHTLSLVTGTAMRCRIASGLAVVGEADAVEHQRLRGFDVDDHLGELAAHQRLVDQPVAERLALPGVTQRFDQGAPRVAQGEQGDPEPGGVGQLHHPAQTLAVRAAAASALVRAASGSPDSRKASASTNSTSPEATERVPSLSFSRRMRMPLRVPSRRVRSTRKLAAPRVESGAPSGLASTTKTWPSQLDANHLKPLSSQAVSAVG